MKMMSQSKVVIGGDKEDEEESGESQGDGVKCDEYKEEWDEEEKQDSG